MSGAGQIIRIAGGKQSREGLSDVPLPVELLNGLAVPTWPVGGRNRLLRQICNARYVLGFRKVTACS